MATGGDAARTYLACVVLLAAASLVGHSLVRWDAAWSAAFGDVQRETVAMERQFECIQAAIERAVPADAPVAVDPALSDPLWEQRLVELAYPRAGIASTPSTAAYLLSVEVAPESPACDGLRLTVRRPA